MRTLAIANQKGGVAKSTLAAHIAYAAVEAGLRVLLVDFDKQGSLSVSFPPVEGGTPGLLASSLFSSTAPEGEPEVLDDNLAIIRADDTLSMLSAGASGAEKRPAQNLRRFAGRYDICVIDTPGAIGFNPPMTVAALVAADAVLCPFSVGLYEAKALRDLWDYIKSIKTPAYNPRLRLMGLLPSLINTQSKQELAALEQLRQSPIGKSILPGILAKRSAVKQAIMRRQPVWKNTRGAGHLAAANEWRAVCAHILADLGGKK